MAARRGKNQATRNSSHATPPWVWLVLGLLIGLAVYFIVPGLGKKDGDGFFRPQPNPDAQPAPIDSADVEAVVPDTPAEAPSATAADGTTPKETQYDFYTLLPGKEVQMSDAELAASAREEEARKARAALNGQSPIAATTPAASDTAAQPAPIDETPAARTPEAPRAADTPPAPKPATTVASADTGARYILQAGAFGASGDAEATKAKIAMLGLSARVESAQINGKTVYRVRMGPYGTASELAEAKQKLASSGLPAMAVKAQ
ncbi:SPOR domain-containing protein [Pseudoxanthomonas sp. PXM02]|uniref:SPOR domain-containing protein n=1 Tax=Pseudoxanthomonas sp. PXM02 TaxID=2769294 RepID=UPI001783F5AF|nr:SPOR domain-containing protein [Pseudoxanthomonas sp. PXM02]MBD9480260.1 SPOR domain-containing protein [Pseudoxanthomonas sp. PXM02]